MSAQRMRQARRQRGAGAGWALHLLQGAAGEGMPARIPYKKTIVLLVNNLP